MSFYSIRVIKVYLDKKRSLHESVLVKAWWYSGNFEPGWYSWFVWARSWVIVIELPINLGYRTLIFASRMNLESGPIHWSLVQSKISLLTKVCYHNVIFRREIQRKADLIRTVEDFDTKINLSYCTTGLISLFWSLPNDLIYANHSNFRVLLKSLGGFVALDKVDVSLPNRTKGSKVGFDTI